MMYPKTYIARLRLYLVTSLSGVLVPGCSAVTQLPSASPAASPVKATHVLVARISLDSCGIERDWVSRWIDHVPVGSQFNVLKTCNPTIESAFPNPVPSSSENAAVAKRLFREFLVDGAPDTPGAVRTAIGQRSDEITILTSPDFDEPFELQRMEAEIKKTDATVHIVLLSKDRIEVSTSQIGRLIGAARRQNGLVTLTILCSE